MSHLRFHSFAPSVHSSSWFLPTSGFAADIRRGQEDSKQATVLPTKRPPWSQFSVTVPTVVSPLAEVQRRARSSGLWQWHPDHGPPWLYRRCVSLEQSCYPQPRSPGVSRSLPGRGASARGTGTPSHMNASTRVSTTLTSIPRLTATVSPSRARSRIGSWST